MKEKRCGNCELWNRTDDSQFGQCSYEVIKPFWHIVAGGSSPITKDSDGYNCVTWKAKQKTTGVFMCRIEGCGLPLTRTAIFQYHCQYHGFTYEYTPL